MSKCDGVYVKEGLRLPRNSVQVAVPVTDAAGNTTIVLKYLRSGRKDTPEDRNNTISVKKLEKLGKVFQVVVTTNDGLVAGLTLDPRNCFGTDGRQFNPSGPDGEALSDIPDRHRQALARQILHESLSYGIQDAKLSAARLSWVMAQLPFEEVLLFATKTGTKPKEIDNLLSALIVHAAVDGIGFLQDNPTLTFMLGKDLLLSAVGSFPTASAKKNAAMLKNLDSVIPDILSLLQKLETTTGRIDALQTLSARSGESPTSTHLADKSMSLSALFDPEHAVRIYAAKELRNVKVRCEALAVLSMIDLGAGSAETFELYDGLLPPLSRFDTENLARQFAGVLAMLPADVRTHVYTGLASLPEGHILLTMPFTEPDPVLLAVLYASRRSGFDTPIRPMITRPADESTAVYDIGLESRITGKSSTDERLVPSASFDIFSSDVAADILLSSHGQVDHDIVLDVPQSLPCHDSWMRRALVERLLGELTNPDLDGEQRTKYVSALRLTAQMDPSTDVRRLVISADSLARETERDGGVYLYKHIAEFDTDANLRALAFARLPDDDGSRNRVASGVPARARVKDFRAIEAFAGELRDAGFKVDHLDVPISALSWPKDLSEQKAYEHVSRHHDNAPVQAPEVAIRKAKTSLLSGRSPDKSPLQFYASINNGLGTYYPPRYHNGECTALLHVDTMSPVEKLQLIRAVEDNYWEHPHSEAILGCIITDSNATIGVEAALAANNPMAALEDIVEMLKPGTGYGYADGDTPDGKVLVELVRRAVSPSRGHDVLENVPAWLLNARADHPEGSVARNLLDRCIAACPGGHQHTADSSDPQVRIVASRNTVLPDKLAVLTELKNGILPAALVLADRIAPGSLRHLESDLVLVEESPARDMMLSQVRERIKATNSDNTTKVTIVDQEAVFTRSPAPVSSPTPGTGSPVVNWHGDTPIRMHYESHGALTGEPIVLLMGQMMQLNFWPQELVTGLVGSGHRVVLVDNRDVGHSTKLAGVPVDSDAAVVATLTGQRAKSPYSLGDMADDVAGLLEHLAIPAARIVGHSMGGMIAQEMAIRHPNKVTSIVSISSMTGPPTEMQSTMEAMLAVTSVAPFADDPEESRTAFIEHSVTYQAFGSKKYRSDERSKAAAAAMWDRAAPDEGSFPRQLAAVYASGNRRRALAQVSETKKDGFVTFIHGTDDTLICPQAAKYDAEYFGKHHGRSLASLVMVDDMGHDLPVELCDHLVSIIVKTP